MGGSADVWSPQTLLNLSADTKRVEQRIVASAGQVTFNITSFTYALGTGALAVYKAPAGNLDAGLLALNTDWAEGSSSTFSLLDPAVAGDVIIAVGYVGITADVDVRDTDIFLTNTAALRAYAGTETAIYLQGQSVAGDTGESFFQKKTGAAPGTYVDDNDRVIVPTAGDGSTGWIRANDSSTLTHVGKGANTKLAAFLQAASRIIATADEDYRIVAAVLRQDTTGSGWYALDDGGHTPIGLDAVTPVEEVGGDIKINYNFNSSSIGSLQVTTDEGYAATPLRMGASVTSSAASISVYYPFEARISGTAVAVQSYLGTKGVEWDVVTDVANGTYTFTHPPQTHADSAGYPITIGSRQEGNNDCIGIQSSLKTGFTLAACRRIAGRTNTSVVITDNAGVSTLAWDGVDTLTITHPTSANANDGQVTCRSPKYHAAIVASTTTTLDIQFYDISTGSLFTGAALPNDIYYSRGSVTPSSISGGLDAYVRRGDVKIDVANLAGASSNLWVYGIFKVA